MAFAAKLEEMSEAEYISIAGRPIVLFDGVCGLCNRFVHFLLRIDRAAILRFAPLESSLGIELLSHFPAVTLDSEGVILITAALTPQAAMYRRSDAILEAFRYLQRPWSMLGILLYLMPRSLREWGYGIVARNRYRLFQKFDTCPIPTEAQRSRILGMYRPIARP